MRLRLPKQKITAPFVESFPKLFSYTTGTPCSLSTRKKAGYVVQTKGKEIHIQYKEISDLALALGDLASTDKVKSCEKIPPYSFRGIMLDVSRNAVMRVDFLKKRLAQFSLLGLNYFCLYTEDTFEVSDEPLWGYGRGRYSKKEIKELVKYAKQFGITMFPCIQTLGHMENLLKLPGMAHWADNESVYNVYADGIYDFIRKTIEHAMEPYETNLVHIGLDETFGMGLGKAFKENTKIDTNKIYLTHLKKVMRICRDLKVDPMMWGDMVEGKYQAKGFNTKEAKGLPKDIEMVYWEYDRINQTRYEEIIDKFFRYGYKPMLSSNVGSANSFFGVLGKNKKNTDIFFRAAQKRGLDRALHTHWGDDGHECLFDYNIYGHTQFLTLCTEKDQETAEAIRGKKFQTIFEEPIESFEAVHSMETLGYSLTSMGRPNLAKAFFYDDPALGFLSDGKSIPKVGKRFGSFQKKYAKIAGKSRNFKNTFRFVETFAEFLADKADLRKELIQRYKKKDRNGLRKGLQKIAALKKLITTLRKQYRALWLAERKPFGLEVIDGRMGALGARLDYLHFRISEFLAKRIDRIDEFDFKNVEQERMGKFPMLIANRLKYKDLSTKCMVR